MEKRTREKIALVVFALLVIFAVAVLTSYFTTGRTWNVAASFVDDTVGSMEGYTAIVYKGVVEPQPEEKPKPPRDSETQPGADTPDASPVGEGEAAEGDRATGTASSLGLDILSMLPPVGAEDDHRVFISDVRALYEQKGAEVLTIEVDDTDYYSTPRVCHVGGKRIGVFSVDVYTTKSWLSRYLRSFDEKDVDAVVCLTPRSNYLASYEGLDAVIVTSDAEGLSTSSKTVGSTLVVRSPQIDEAGVVLLTANNVASSRVIDAL